MGTRVTPAPPALLARVTVLNTRTCSRAAWGIWETGMQGEHLDSLSALGRVWASIGYSRGPGF